MFKTKRELPEKYRELQKVYSQLKTDEDRLRVLGEMLDLIPTRTEYNKVRSYTTHLMRELRDKLRKKARREAAEALSRRFFKDEMFSIAFVGDANSGKTHLLNSICGSDYPSTWEAFETKEPVIGVFDHKGVRLRIVEVPSFIQPKHAKILHECDLIILFPESDRYQEFINDQFIETPVKVLKSYPKNKWVFLGLRVINYKDEPLVIFKGTSLGDLDLEYALVNGKEEKIDYVLKEGDIVK